MSNNSNGCLCFSKREEFHPKVLISIFWVGMRGKKLHTSVDPNLHTRIGNLISCLFEPEPGQREGQNLTLEKCQKKCRNVK